MAVTVRQNLQEIGQAWKANLGAMLGFGLLAVLIQVGAGYLIGEPLFGDFQSEVPESWPMRAVDVATTTALTILFAPRVLPSIKAVPYNRFFAVLAIDVVTSLAVGMGLALLIIPGIILAVIFAAAGPLALDRGVDEALTQSIRLGWGRFWWVLGTTCLVFLAVLGFGLIALVTFFALGPSHPALLVSALPFLIVAGPGLTIARLVTARNLEGVRVAPDVVAAFD